MKKLSYIELNKSSLLHNLTQFKKINEGKICAVVKSNAYGHGLEEIVEIINGQVDYYQVDDYLEFIQIRKFTDTKVFVFGYLLESQLEKVVTNKGIPGLYSIGHIKKLDQLGKKHKTKFSFHLKVDCLLGRQGFLVKDLPVVLKYLSTLKNIELAGIYTHFSNIEDASNLKHAKKQVSEFKKALNLVEKHGFYNLDTHINSTSGILVKENLGLKTTISRLGIGLYGLWRSEGLCRRYGDKIELRPVLKWITHVAQVKELPKGYPVGYGLTYVAPKKTKIAIVPQGYADGYDRRLSNIGHVIIKDKKCRVLGRVAMNMFAVDVTEIGDVKQMDRVILLGKGEREEITSEDIAKSIDTINYEVVARISPSLPRVVV